MLSLSFKKYIYTDFTWGSLLLVVYCFVNDLHSQKRPLILVFSLYLSNCFDDHFSPSLFRVIHKYKRNCSHMDEWHIYFLVDFKNCKIQRNLKNYLQPWICLQERKTEVLIIWMIHLRYYKQVMAKTRLKPDSGLNFHSVSSCFMFWSLVCFLKMRSSQKSHFSKLHPHL